MGKTSIDNRPRWPCSQCGRALTLAELYAQALGHPYPDRLICEFCYCGEVTGVQDSAMEAMG